MKQQRHDLDAEAQPTGPVESWKDPFTSALHHHEVMVIVGVLILGLICLIPFFLSNQKKKRAADGAMNLRQWGIALNLSMPDTNNTLPSEGDYENAPESSVAWFNALPPYLSQKALSEMTTKELPKGGDKTIWVSPAITKKEAERQKPILFCYGMNTYLSGSDAQGRKYETLRITQLDNPSATVFLGEKLGTDSVLSPDEVRARWGKGSRPTVALFLFCDGHVEGLKKEVFEPRFNPSAVDADAPGADFTYIPFGGARAD